MTTGSTLLSLMLLALGCGGAPVQETPSALSAATLFPLRSSLVWSYNIDVGEEAPVLGILRVVRAEGDRFELQSDGDDQTTTYERRPEGIWKEQSQTWILREPIAVGQRWDCQSERECEITEVNASVSVASGQRYDRCTVVVERGSDLEITTTYCVDVGPVVIETARQMDITGRVATIRAELLGFGEATSVD